MYASDIEFCVQIKGKSDDDGIHKIDRTFILNADEKVCRMINLHVL
jgi:hypothetical protein